MRQYYCLYLVVCCLFIRHVNVIIAQEVQPPNPINRLLNIQTELQKLQDDLSSSISALKTANINNLAVLEPSNIDFQFLKKEIADVIKTTEISKEPANGLVQSTPKEDQLSSDIIEDIKQRRFDLAEEKLKKVNNLQVVSEIIRAVYDHNSNNFELLAGFIESLSNINLIYASVNDLRKEMDENEHTNPYKCIRLSKILETIFINPPEVDYFTTEFGKVTHNILKEEIADFTLKSLNAAVHKDGIYWDADLDDLTIAVYRYDPDQWETIIYELVNSNIDSVHEVLDIIDSHKLIEQKVRAVNILYWLVKFIHNPKSDETIRIASILSEIRSDEMFQQLNNTLKELVQNIIDDLPICARNLFFLQSACLWNQGAQAYLTALNSSYKNDTTRRQVFSTQPLPESHWYFQNIDNYFVISSTTYEDELLSAAKVKHSPNLRHVFNRISKNRKQIRRRSKWLIELDNDYCYVKSAKYKEYLITSNFYFGNSLRYVFTWVPEPNLEKAQFRWQIRECN